MSNMTVFTTLMWDLGAFDPRLRVIHADVCEKTLLLRRGHVERQAPRAKNQGLKSSFCRWIAGHK